MDQTFNANLVTECIKSVREIGYTHYVNICTGQTHDVSWGSMDVVFTIAFPLILWVTGYITYRFLRDK